MRPIGEIDRIIGARIRERRVMEGKSQEWVALELDISLQFISRYELGEKRIPVTDAIRICKLLGWTMEALLQDLADMDPQDSRAPLSSDALRIAIALDELSIDDPNKVLMSTVKSLVAGAREGRRDR